MMSTDRPSPPRRSLLAAVVALGIAAVLLIGGRGTYAYWTDSADVTGTGFTSGKLDLTVNGAQGNPTAQAVSSLALTGMVPGESVSANITLANAGDADFTWTASASTGGGLGPALTVAVHIGSASANDTTYPRTETCGGSAITLGSTATRLNKGASSTVCVLVTLPSSTGNAYQSQTSGSVTVTFDATQVLA